MAEKQPLFEKLKDKSYSLLQFFSEFINDGGQSSEIRVKTLYGSYFATCLVGEEGCRNQEEY